MKKVLSLFLSLVMLFTITAGIDFSSYAAGNSISNATSLLLNTEYSGYISTANEKDVYKFTLSSSGMISISITANIYRSKYYLYDENGVSIWESYTSASRPYVEWNDVTQQMTLNKKFDLTSGVYYFAATKYDGTGNYKFKIDYISSNETYIEQQGGSNNTIITANLINLGKRYYGQLAINDDKDLYKFTLASSGKISLSVKANIYKTRLFVYDADRNIIWESYTSASRPYLEWDDVTQQMTLNKTFDLVGGTYYFAIAKYDGTGNYNFSICCHTYSSTITKQATCTANGIRTYTCKNCNSKWTESISALGHKYTTKVVKPTYTSGGYTLHTCTRCKKNYKDKKTKKLVLKNTSISKITAGKKAFTIKWKKQSAATGYQIQYATDKNFKKNKKTVTVSKNKTTSKKISKLKAKKKYYVRIRTYKTVKVNGKNTKVYSSWSKAKTVKTK